MTDLEKLIKWLKTCPYLPGAVTLQLDHVHSAPGSAGLYPRGMEEISRREDVLGNVTVTYRQKYLLYQVSYGNEAAGVQSARLLAFQKWVAQQCLAGTAPVFGDVPQMEKIWAEKGKLQDLSKTGTCKHVVEITVQFQKIFERS